MILIWIHYYFICLYQVPDFKNIYYDIGLDRAVAKFIPIDDLYVPYLATDILTCERVTHSLRKSQNEIRKLQVSGFYRDVESSGLQRGNRITSEREAVSQEFKKQVIITMIMIY